MGIAVSLVLGIRHHVDILEGHEERMYAVHSVVLGCGACGHLLLANLEQHFCRGGEAGFLDHILATSADLPQEVKKDDIVDC